MRPSAEFIPGRNPLFGSYPLDSPGRTRIDLLSDYHYWNWRMTMPLDPQAKAFLDQLTAAGAPALNALPVAEARQALRTLFSPGAPEPIHKVENRQVPGPAGQIP